jgi:hypothetical protein
MTKPTRLMALALFAGACGSVSATSDGGVAGQRGGIDGSAGSQSGMAGATTGAAGAAGASTGTAGAAGATTGTAGAAGATTGAAGAMGAAGATTGAAGATSLGPPTACVIDPPVNGGPTTPCAVTCGNGTIDSCMYTVACPGPAGHVCPMQTFTEICDGNSLGSASCPSLGYAGGTLRCGAWCGFDTRECDSCAHNAGVAACVSAVPEVATPNLFALAASDTEIGIAWIDGESYNTRTGLRFARFKPDLSRLSLSDCFGPANPTQVALASTATGWIVAATVADGVHVFALSPAGAPMGTERVIAGAKDPLLVSGSASGVLLYWTAGQQSLAELVLPSSAAATTPVVVFPYAIDTTSGVYTGDGFLLASRLALVWTTRIANDGTVASQMMLASAPKPNGYAPGLAWGGATGAITYYTDNDPAVGGSSLVWLPVLSSGAPMGASKVIGSSPLTGTSMSTSGAPVATQGTKTFVLTSPTQDSLQVATVDPLGASTGAPFGLTKDPNLVRIYRLGKQGTNVIAAWTTGGGLRTANVPPGRIGLARPTP